MIRLDEVAEQAARLRGESLTKVSTPLSALVTLLTTGGGGTAAGSAAYGGQQVADGEIGIGMPMLLGGLGALYGLRKGTRGKREALQKYKYLKSLHKQGDPTAGMRMKAMQSAVNEEAASRGLGGALGAGIGYGLGGAAAGTVVAADELMNELGSML